MHSKTLLSELALRAHLNARKYQLLATFSTLWPMASDSAAHKDGDYRPSVKQRRSTAGRLSSFFRSGGSKTSWTPTRGDLSPLRNSLTLDEPDYLIQEEDAQNNAGDGPLDALRSLRPESQATWRKVVELPPDEEPPSYPPRPALSPEKARPAPVPSSTGKHQGRSSKRYFSPKLFFWDLSCILCVFLVTIGVLSALGHSLQPGVADTGLSLLVSPREVAVGATLSLRGRDFAPRGEIGLSRDVSIPIVDTANATIVRADAQGNFSDTVVVQADWGVGAHTISAEDAITHKATSYPILIVGKGDPLRPAHLSLSTNSLNLGTGDQATNSKLMVTLTNLGGGQIAWQGSSTQSWLKISPESGTVYSGLSGIVTVAVDRANLQPGDYTAQLLLTSNAGNEIISVETSVTQFDFSKNAVLQLTPSVLSFSAADGEVALAPQIVTVSNPGWLPLDWQGHADVPWLTLFSSSGTLDPLSSVPVAVGINSRALLPGIYNGTITFSVKMPDDTTLHSPQSVSVSVTIMPRCALTLTPPLLSFTAAYQHPAQLTKMINVGMSPSCESSLSWKVSSPMGWLKTDQPNGNKPGTVTVSVDDAGLEQGTYDGVLTFTSATGSQIVLVSFVLGPPDMPVLLLDTSILSFTGITAIGDSSTRTLTLTNTGGGTLSWRASAETSAGGTWLSARPSSGALSARQSVQVSVTASTLSGLKDASYTGMVVFSGKDGSGNIATGGAQNVPVSFLVRPACTLQAPSAAMGNTINFTTIAGQNPSSQSATFTIGVTGTCNGSVTVTPTRVNNASWLTVSPAKTARVGAPASFTVTVNPTGLAVSQYAETISLAAVNNRISIISSPQQMKVILNVGQPPTLAASTDAGGLTFTQATGAVSQTITLSNTGTGALNWNAALQNGAPAFLSLSTMSGSGLTTRNNAAITVTVDATGQASGMISTGVEISATDAATGLAVGSPVTLPVTITIPQPAMQVSSTALAFESTQGSNPAAKAVRLSNSGGGTLTWTTSGLPGWLTISQNVPSIAAQSATALTFQVDASGLSVGTTTVSVLITPLVGSPVPIQVSVTVDAPSTPTPSGSPTPSIIQDTPSTVQDTPTLTPTTAPATDTPMHSKTLLSERALRALLNASKYQSRLA